MIIITINFCASFQLFLLSNLNEVFDLIRIMMSFHVNKNNIMRSIIVSIHN